MIFNKGSEKDRPSNKETEDKDFGTLARSLEANVETLKEIFKGDETLKLRKLRNRVLSETRFCALYFDGMVNTELVNENIIQPIMNHPFAGGHSSLPLLEELHNNVIVSNEVVKENKISSIINSLIRGHTVVLVNGYDHCLVVNSKVSLSRAITEPESSRLVRGPREGFTEAIMTNLSLIRKIINNQDLKMKFKEIGERTHTKVCVCYIEGLALEEILQELDKRLDDITLDGILDSGYIQEMISDAPFSLFETVGYSERPDVVAAKLLEGRVAIIVDGSPFVLTVPYVLIEGLQANEDYYSKYIYSTFYRLLRLVGVFLAMGLPAIYLSLACFHQELLPTRLLISVSASRQGVPFPTVITLSGMLLVFDVIREAGIRMPSPIGQAVNIVGTLVLGQAAVEAKLVSAPVVIVTALSGMLTMLSPVTIGMVVLVRYLLIIAASFLGIYGYIFGMILVVLHMLNLRSFGIPYVLGLTSVKNHNGQDIWVRAPWWSMTLRPKLIGAKNLVRQSRKNR
ncbi:spore germination protein [Bacillus tuaregi]|uniref:spore germination protein n=1 Tax=Bacillus tuaregi TaxID=1816695 RepID=UPI0008F94AF4|nr:spore germination protein [Bacillus tuaregi]